MPNRLATESSPYLLQHRDNPVDWYPWGAEAFEAAKREDKPIFLSIGYAACHWCHVMAHESFESDATAELMNRHFVNVKVDREERPDVDAIYMNAIQVLGQGGGWPLSAFCTPDGKPFFLGTYFPPDDRYGRPSFPRVLEIMSKLWREERDKVLQNSDAILEGLHKIDEHYRAGATGAAADASVLDSQRLVAAGRWLAQRADPVHGGFGTQPKFPSSSSHELLARAARLPLGEPARAAFLLQAKQMARGGIYDHLGGGFARYSVDARWLVPHFEKMLYDNAQLLGVYGEAHAMTGDAEYARVIAETVDWLEREMQHASGALYASQDADSEGEEGKYYVWTPPQVAEVLGAEDAALFARHYGVTERGNFEHGTTVLSRVTEPGDDAEEAELGELRAKLFAARDRRVHPGTDDKVLAGWNALAVAGLVRAWEATGQDRALALARRVAGFLATEMVHDGARMWRVYKDGDKKLDGTIDDYAFTGDALLALAEAELMAAPDDPGAAARASRWWELGRSLLRAVVDRFYEERDGLGIFYMTPRDAADELVHRPESHHDGAIPSGAAVAVGGLVRLGLVAGERDLLAVAERYLAQRVPQASPHVASRLLAALDLYLHGAELVVTEGSGRAALLAAARQAHAPARIVAGPWASASIREGKSATSDGRAQAFVCRGQTCSAPVTAAEDLVKLLAYPGK
jgi:uncharacterized protein YyaL (SSP411 family)